MKNIFIINGGQNFAQSKGRFNQTITEVDVEFFTKRGYQVKVTNINDVYVIDEEADKFVWADVIIYHMPIWWFQIPHKLKTYFDCVFEHGKIYNGDGRSSANPAINYGTGGLLQGKKYMVTTSWNAPNEAFTLPGEFFEQTNVDNGVLFGFHKMNAFIGLEKMQGFHFYDVVKNGNIERDRTNYKAHLASGFNFRDQKITL